MSDLNVFTARGVVCKQIEEAAVGLPFDNTDGYTLAEFEKLMRGLKGVLEKQFNPNGGGGMGDLMLENGDLVDIVSTEHHTAESVMAADEAAAKAKNKDDPKLSFPERSDAIEEANRLNLYVQVVLGAKEGACKVLEKLLGTAVTDAVLKEPLSNEPKSIDSYKLFDLLEAGRQGATNMTSKQIITKLVETIVMPYDFKKRVAVNVELQKAKIKEHEGHGIKLTIGILVHSIIAKIEEAARKPWGQEYVLCLQNIKRDYPPSTVHTEDTLNKILAEIAKADGTRTLNDAETIELGIANLADGFELLTDLLHGAESEEESEGYAAAAESDSDSSADTRRSSRSRSTKKASKKSRSSRSRKSSPERSRSKSTSRSKWRDNPCKHCKAYKRNRQHPNVDEKDCFWNKQFKGWRPHNVCIEMEIPYKPKAKFADSDSESD